MDRKQFVAALAAHLCWLQACAIESPPAQQAPGLASAAHSDPPLDTHPPAAITDLQVISVQSTRATLRWTAPGDDATTGTAATYDLRLSTIPIDPSTFAIAVPVPTPAPDSAGTVQTVEVLMPPAARLYLAMHARDEQDNLSALSNLVEVDTPEGAPLYIEGAESEVEGWTMTGLWHATRRRAFAGKRSFWYGQEITSNYATGASNMGELRSPIIHLADTTEPVLSYFERIDVEQADAYDVLEVIITNVGDSTRPLTLPKRTGSTGGAFQPRVQPLAALAGSPIQLVYRLNTVDEHVNDREGWYIDDIRITGAAPGAGAQKNQE